MKQCHLFLLLVSLSPPMTSLDQTMCATSHLHRFGHQLPNTHLWLPSQQHSIQEKVNCILETFPRIRNALLFQNPNDYLGNRFQFETRTISVGTNNVESISRNISMQSLQKALANKIKKYQILIKITLIPLSKAKAHGCTTALKPVSLPHNLFWCLDNLK